MTRPLLVLSRWLGASGPLWACVVLSFLSGLAGCRGLPWSSTDGAVRVSSPIDPISVAGDLQIHDGSRVEPAGLQLSLPSPKSDWLAGTPVVAIVNGEPSPVPPEQSLQVMQILDGIYQSEDSGREFVIE